MRSAQKSPQEVQTRTSPPFGWHDVHGQDGVIVGPFNFIWAFNPFLTWLLLETLQVLLLSGRSPCTTVTEFAKWNKVRWEWELWAVKSNFGFVFYFKPHQSHTCITSASILSKCQQVFSVHIKNVHTYWGHREQCGWYRGWGGCCSLDLHLLCPRWMTAQ